MKKFIFLITILFTLVSCERDANSKLQTKQEDCFKLERSDDSYIKIKVDKFEYNNHRYISFTCKRKLKNIIHDPDCPCKEKR